MAKQTLTAESVLADLRAGRFSSVYFLMGEEPYYIDLISDYIQNNVLDETQREFDQLVLYGKDTDMRTVIDAARGFPMMGGRQVVIVKEAQHIKAWDDLVYYLQRPQPSTVLVFCYKYGTPDGRKKWFAELKRAGVVFESPRVRDYEVGAWIKRYAQGKGLAVDEKGVAMLAEYLGTDLGKIANELDKLAITSAGARITPEVIEKNIGISKDYNVFELQAALVNRDVLKANRIVRYFGDNKKANPLVVVLAQLFNFFANLMLYHYLPDKSQMAVASELKVNPYFVRDYERAARVFNAWKTMYIISYIRDTDARAKGIDNASADDGELLKELVYKILH